MILMTASVPSASYFEEGCVMISTLKISSEGTSCRASATDEANTLDGLLSMNTRTLVLPRMEGVPSGVMVNMGILRNTSTAEPAVMATSLSALYTKPSAEGSMTGLRPYTVTAAN